MTWLPATAIAGLPQLPGTPAGIHRRAGAEGWHRRQAAPQMGRPATEYHLASLPAAAQQAWAAQQSLSPTPTPAPAAQAAAPVIALQDAGALCPASNPKLDVLQRLLAYHHHRGGALWPCMQEFAALWARGAVPAHAATRQAYPALPAKTLDKWLRAWRIEGVAALQARKPRADKGRTRLLADDTLYAAFVAALSELHDPTARQVRRVVAHQVGEANAPALGTLKRWLADWRATNAPALLALKDPDGYRNKYKAAFGSRGEHIARPNQQWQLDSTVGDAQTRADLLFDLPDAQGTLRRHAVVCCIDVFTRRASVVLAPTSSANAVKSVFRAQALAWGQPEQIKTDNGRDYTAQDFDFALQALGVEHILCTPFSPDQKPFIERFIGTLMHDLFGMLEGFVGHNVAQAQAIRGARSFAERFGAGAVPVRMGAQQLQTIINGWLDEYHSRRHTELACSPNDMAARHAHRVRLVDARALDLFLAPVAGKGVRVVTKRGIALDAAWFRAPELAACVGQSVRVRQDALDLGRLQVFALDGSYICEAIDHTLLGINRAELAAKANAIERAHIQPQVDALRKALKKGLAKQTVQALYADRAEAALQAGGAQGNVTRLVRKELVETPATAAYLAAIDTSTQDAARQAARALFDNTAQAAAPQPTVEALGSPIHRYSAWVRLQSRMARQEAVSQRELTWGQGYATSAEWASWHELHEGADPLNQEAAM